MTEKMPQLGAIRNYVATKPERRTIYASEVEYLAFVEQIRGVIFAGYRENQINYPPIFQIPEGINDSEVALARQFLNGVIDTLIRARHVTLPFRTDDYRIKKDYRVGSNIGVYEERKQLHSFFKDETVSIINSLMNGSSNKPWNVSMPVIEVLQTSASFIYEAMIIARKSGATAPLMFEAEDFVDGIHAILVDPVAFLRDLKRQDTSFLPGSPGWSSRDTGGAPSPSQTAGKGLRHRIGLTPPKQGGQEG